MLRSERLRALRNTWAEKTRAGQHFVGQHATDTVRPLQPATRPPTRLAGNKNH